MQDTLWGRLDTLVVDTPPGTSDEHLTIVRLLATTRPSGAVILTSPQRLAAGALSSLTDGGVEAAIDCQLPK